MRPSSPARPILTTFAVAAVLSLTACHAATLHEVGATSTPASPTSPTSPTSAPPSITRADLDQTWVTAVDTLNEGTRYRVESDYLGISVTEKGVAVPAPARLAYTYTYRSSGGTTHQSFVRSAGEEFYREKQTGTPPDTDTGRCWLHKTTSASPLAPAVRVIDNAVPVHVSQDGRTVKVRASVEDLLFSDGGHFATDLGITDYAEGTIGIDVSVKDGRIVGWRANDGDLLRAAVKAGGKLDDFLRQNRTFFDHLEMDATFTDPGPHAARTIGTPDPAITFDSLKRIEQSPVCRAGHTGSTSA